MTPDQATYAINKVWIEQWAALGKLADGTAVPTLVDNIIRDTNAPGTYFSRLQINHFGSEQTTIGKRSTTKHEHEGIIEVKLNGPQNVGRQQLDQLAKIVQDIFRRRRIGRRVRDAGVITQSPALSELRRDSESPRHWLLTVSTPFTYYSVG